MSASLTARSIALAVLLLSPLAFGWGSDLKLPAPAPVVDEFGLLDQRDNASLTEILRGAKERSGVEISVYVPTSLQGREIEDFSIAVAEQWKLGRKKDDRALLFVIAPKERKMRIEVGYGLEGEITDHLGYDKHDSLTRSSKCQLTATNGV